MSGEAKLVYDDGLTAYDFGGGHPMSPIRVQLTIRLARELGILDQLTVVPAPMADDELLRTVHTAEYVDAVRRAGANPDVPDEQHGLGTDDTYCFPGMHEASARIAGASVEAARSVWQGEVLHAANVAGGLHHAMPNRASGFCVYNDPAIAIQWLLDNGAERVAYVDVDVHHGDGVQEVFYNDPRVLTVSLHESPTTLFPGTGSAGETGGPGAEGSAVNIPLPPGTGDAGWLRAFHAIVPDVLRAFRPSILVTQHGCDSHVEDPLAHLTKTVDGQRAAYLALHDLAHELTGGKWVATGGGGYAIIDVVPRAWSHLLAIVAGKPVDPQTPVPEAWREEVQIRFGRVAPLRMTDGRDPEYVDWSSGYNPGAWLDRSIKATRDVSFPLLGLDPTY
ncbi:acetoin utilization protein AcuC [Kribbella sandramycini]|uniref:Acetoin utilization protein AcuC n=1 Tax=Kribbella sandramycini TaxID=60450 RepID=A0A7Y4L3L9_9ACTN|nr:acetoin utilization protein AcuC [Kribbella sandramycini]MBB6564889.1 acetoin utilization protein AcuC [Kribbella sandramycini]NOL42586.1 acetoin utilization protein AcuC [Kribbella sandramycini]